MLKLCLTSIYLGGKVRTTTPHDVHCGRSFAVVLGAIS